jgi:signal transduction histidine kinase
MNRALKFRRRLGGVAAALTLILFVAFYFAFRIASQTAGTNFMVSHTHEVLGLIGRVRLERSRLAIMLWNFRATRNPELPGRFEKDDADLRADLERLRWMTSDNKTEEARAAEIEQILLQQLPQLEQAMKKTIASPQGLPLSSMDWTLPTLPSDRLRQLYDQMEESEQELLRTRAANLQRNTDQTHVVLILSGLVTLAIIGVGLYLIQREILTRAKAEQGMRQAQALLGVRYDEQSHELTHVAEDLHEQIVERRAAEQRLSILNQELEERVKERTAELQEMNKEMEAFSYSVSHDLRAPLRHMEGFSRILQQEYGSQLPEEAQHYLNRIRDASIHMAALVEDLLKLSKVGRQAVQHQAVPMRELVEAARLEAVFDIGDRNIQWKIDELPHAAGDPVLLRQVLANLLANAVKFTRNQSNAVIEIGHRSSGKEEIYFVKDNGAGFDQRYADKLFGVFQRLHRQDEFEGTGIGLATVQRIMHKHGGRVWAEAEIGKGATFYFSLPAEDGIIAAEHETAGVAQ